MRNKLIIVFVLLFSAGASAYDWQTDLKHRLLCDFTESRTNVVNFIRTVIPNASDEKIAQWEASGALECMEIDGEKRYFHQAARNLFRIDPACRKAWDERNGNNNFYADNEIACMRNMPQILRDAPAHPQHIAQARRIRISYTITVQPDAVPAGEMVRCWMPFPRRDHVRQTDVQLLSTSQPDYQIARPEATHSSLYMERKAEAGKPVTFSESFEFTAHGSRFDLSDVKAYNTKSKLYKEYTREREQHVRFTPELRALADSLTRGIDNPVLKAKALFTYINDHFPWASAREYSTIPNIPMYVLKNRHGDCGQVSLLFVTLCRICGIPAHFQSGWQMHPGAVNLHDWSEVYFEGIGWVPVDQSYGIMNYSQSPDERYFYFGGIDSWRFLVNADFGKSFSPKKKFPRSETVDFQRGEVEWRGGNVYFDQWSYDIDVEYLD